MEVFFYLFSFIAVISTIGVIFGIYPVYALLCLIIHCISLSCIFFILGANVAGVLEIIIYAGAIMVLFIFVVMMLNVNFLVEETSDSLLIQCNLRKLFLIFVFLMIFLYIIWSENSHFYINNNANSEIITFKDVGISLFGDYILLIEMASMLLLGSLVISLRIVRGYS